MKLYLDRGDDTQTVFTPVGNGDAQTLFNTGGLVAPIDLTQASQVTKAGVARSVIKASLMIPTATVMGDLANAGSLYALPKTAVFEAHIVLSAPRTVVQLCRNSIASANTLSLAERVVSTLVRSVVTTAVNSSLPGSDAGPDGLVTNGGMPIVQSLTGKQAFDPVSGTYGEGA